jgi:hypothetical protein
MNDTRVKQAIFLYYVNKRKVYGTLQPLSIDFARRTYLIYILYLNCNEYTENAVPHNIRIASYFTVTMTRPKNIHKGITLLQLTHSK